MASLYTPLYSRFTRWSHDERTLQSVDYCRRRRKRWAARCKNALQQLNELRPGLEYRVVSQTGPCHRPVFTVHVQLSGQVLSLLAVSIGEDITRLMICWKFGT